MFSLRPTSLIWCLLISCQLVLANSNISSEISYALRFDVSGLQIVNTNGISINCTNCYFHGDLSLSSGSIDSLPDSNFSSLPFNFSQDWAAAVVEDFVGHFELDFSMLNAPNGQSVEASKGLIPLHADGITFSRGAYLVDVDWTFNPTIHTAVNTSTPVNFTYGFEFTMPVNSAIFIAFDGNNSKVQTIGFDQSQITPLNYTSNEMNEDFAFEMSFRPEFGVSLSGAEVVELVSGTVFADIPNLNVTVHQVHNVTQDCQPARAGTSSDKIFSDLTYVVPSLGYDIGYEFDVVDVDPEEKTWAVGNNKTLQTSCLMYSAQANALVPVPNKSQGWRLTALTGRGVALWVIAVTLTQLM